MKYVLEAQFAHNPEPFVLELDGEELAGLVQMFALGFAGEHASVEAGNTPSASRALFLSVKELA